MKGGCRVTCGTREKGDPLHRLEPAAGGSHHRQMRPLPDRPPAKPRRTAAPARRCRSAQPRPTRGIALPAVLETLLLGLAKLAVRLSRLGPAG